jgi:hypothetical protein
MQIRTQRDDGGGSVSHETTYFLLGIAISIPIAVLAPIVTTQLQKWWSRRSSKEARKRQQLLESEMAAVARYHDSPHQFTQYLLVRLIVLNLVWLLDGVLSDIFGVTSNGFTTISSFAEGTTTIDLNKYASVINSISSVTSILVLTISVRVGLRAYRLWKRVHEYNDYKRKVEAELQALAEVTGEALKPPTTADPETSESASLSS